MSLTRELIASGWVQETIGSLPEMAGKVLSIEQLRESWQACLAARPEGGEIWVFGYGSLIWNPCFHHVAQRSGTALGWHRRFCLWTHMGRGTRERPGLMLGLEPGGRCTGVAFRLPPDAIEQELEIVWRREMVTGAYRPIWVSLVTPDGPLRAIAFAMNRAYDRYAGRLTEAAIVQTLATAAGPLGRCCDYLFSTSQHLDELGIGDRRLRRLCEEVRKMQAEEAFGAPALVESRDGA